MSSDKYYVIRTEIPIPTIVMERIRQGHMPEQMEDKWFMYFENNIIHYHRSWTGCNTFNAYCEERKDGYAITKIEVDMEDYNTNPRRAPEALDYFLQALAWHCGVSMDYPVSISVQGEAVDELPQEEVSHELPVKERFRQYVANKRTESSANAYVSTLDNPVRRFIHDIVDPDADSIYSFTTAEEVKACIDKLNASSVYVETNESKHRIMSAALSNYLKFMEQQ